MKKLLISILTIIIVLNTSVVSAETEEENCSDGVITELTPKFVYETGTVLRNDVYVRYLSLNRGDELLITDEDDDYYYIDYYGLTLSVPKDYVRTENETPIEPYTVYTRSGVGLYSDVDLNNRISSFSLNDTVTVIDSFAGILLVETDNGQQGYMIPSAVSKNKIVIYVAPKVETPAYEEPSGGGSSGGSPAPAPAPTPAPTPSGQDGEDITLDYKVGGTVMLLGYSKSVKGNILADGTNLYISVFQRGNIVKILQQIEDNYEILINGRKAVIPVKYVRKDSEPAYEAWDGYARGSGVYADFNITQRIGSLSTNQNIHVVDEVDGIYVVELSDGSIGYMAKGNVSKDKIIVYVAPKVETPSYEEPSGGGSSGGGSSPAPAPAPTPEPEPEWTDPVL